MLRRRIVIIGAGVAGMAAAIRLAAQGCEVHVLERNATPGGKMAELQLGAYRFDMGPSLFTLPHLVEELLALVPEAVRPSFAYKKLSILNQYFWDDGTVIKAFADHRQFAREVEAKLGVEHGVVERFFQHSAFIKRHTWHIFLTASLQKLSLWKISVLKSLLRLPGMDATISMNRANKKRLRHPKLVQLFNRFATYNGSDPYRAPGILNVIPSLEHLEGAYFPTGGMYRIVTCLQVAAEQLGVNFHFQEKATRILHDGKNVSGVETDRQIWPADVVISNMDVHPTYKKLLPTVQPPAKILAQERSTSAIVFYWGMRKSFPRLELHNVFFSNQYKEEFEALFVHKNIHPDPTVYLHISARESPGDAPEAMDNWFVMINAPANDGQDWNDLKQQARVNILRKLSRVLGEDVAAHIVIEETLDPVRIENNTGSYKGSLYGASSNSAFAAFLRHQNSSRQMQGLFFCGGSVHPGGGIPLCLLSAKITTSLITEQI
jgi:phytoene desaturase